MSIRENIEIFHQVDIGEYLTILKQEYGAQSLPDQPGVYIAGNPLLPFYRPQQAKDHVFVLGVSFIPLPDVLIQALLTHSELIPDATLVRWTQEQELILETSIGYLRWRIQGYGR